MSISTLESSASVKALDNINRQAEERAALVQFHADEFTGEIMRGELWQACRLSQARPRYTYGQPDRVVRHQILTEFVADLLSCGVEELGDPTVEQAVAIVIRAARGENVHIRAKELLADLSQMYGQDKTEGTL